MNIAKKYKHKIQNQTTVGSPGPVTQLDRLIDGEKTVVSIITNS